MRGSYTRGVLFVHSTPPALCPHIEWALGTALGQEVRLQWSDQDAAPGIRAALESATTYEELREGLDLALGQAWDDELESFRHAGAGAPVRWLNNRVG